MTGIANDTGGCTFCTGNKLSGGILSGNRLIG